MKFRKVQAIHSVSLFIPIAIGTSFSLFTFPVSAQNDTAGDNHINMLISQMPAFPGNLDYYLEFHLHYPPSAIDRGIQGTVNVTLVIT